MSTCVVPQRGLGSVSVVVTRQHCLDIAPCVGALRATLAVLPISGAQQARQQHRHNAHRHTRARTRTHARCRAHPLNQSGRSALVQVILTSRAASEHCVAASSTDAHDPAPQRCSPSSALTSSPVVAATTVCASAASCWPFLPTRTHAGAAHAKANRCIRQMCVGVWRPTRRQVRAPHHARTPHTRTDAGRTLHTATRKKSVESPRVRSFTGKRTSGPRTCRSSRSRSAPGTVRRLP